MSKIKTGWQHGCRLVEQVCDQCGKHFQIFYNFERDADGKVKVYYDYPMGACNCEAEFSPIDGEPSLTEWEDQIKEALGANTADAGNHSLKTTSPNPSV